MGLASSLSVGSRVGGLVAEAQTFFPSTRTHSQSGASMHSCFVIEGFLQSTDFRSVGREVGSMVDNHDGKTDTFVGRRVRRVGRVVVVKI